MSGLKGLIGDLAIHSGSARLDEKGLDPALLQPPVVAAVAAGITILLWKLLPLLFTRIQPQNALANKRRQTFYETVLGTPGISFRQLVRLKQVPPSSALHHLRILEKVDLIRMRLFGKQVRIYPAEMTRQRMETLALLGNPTAKKIGEFIASHPGVSQMDILAAIPDTPRSSIQLNLHRLAVNRIIQVQRHGRRRIYRAALEQDELRSGEPA